MSPLAWETRQLFYRWEVIITILALNHLFIHFAILLPDRKALATALKRLMENDWPIEGAADHGVSEAIYLRDPYGNGIELYVDRPKEEWPKDDKGSVIMYTRALDIEGLMSLVK